MTCSLRGLLIVGVSLVVCGCDKAQLDDEVDRLCRMDGGIRVYETVRLPEDMVDQRGVVFPKFVGLPSDNGRYGPNFIVTVERKILVSGNPDLYRTHIKVIRRSDGKLLGEDVSYTRRGGDIPGPWHPSHHSCPHVTEAPDVIHRVFVKE